MIGNDNHDLIPYEQIPLTVYIFLLTSDHDA